MKVLSAIKAYYAPIICLAALSVSGFMFWRCYNKNQDQSIDSNPVISLPISRETSVGKMIRVPVVTQNQKSVIIWEAFPKKGTAFEIELLERQFIFNAQLPGIYTVVASTDGATALAVCNILVHGSEPNVDPDDKKQMPPPPPAEKRKLLLAAVYDMKSPPLSLAALVANKAFTDKLESSGHELRTYDKNSRDLQTNGVAAVLTQKNIAPPALVIMWADEDRGRVVTAIPCPTNEQAFLKAISDAGGR